MGIKNLNKLLKKICPDIFETKHISSFAYKKIAIDTSLYICKFKSIYGDDWLNPFINLVGSLRKNEVHCVFIFDGKSPVEKEKEREKRKEAKNKLKNDIYEIEDSLNVFYKTHIVDKVLINFHNKIRKKSVSLLIDNSKKIDIKLIENKLEQKRKQVINISPNDFILIRKLLDILKIPYYTAPWEAEKMCAKLCLDSLVDGVLSEDTDLMAYKTPLFLSKIDTYNHTFIEINYEKLLESMELTSSEFLDICIMSGTDYNENIFKIGSIKSYNYIKKHKNIEEFAKETNKDVSILNHSKCREMFRNFEEYGIKVIPYCGIPDFKKLEELISEENIKVNIENIKSKFVNTKIEFN